MVIDDKPEKLLDGHGGHCLHQVLRQEQAHEQMKVLLPPATEERRTRDDSGSCIVLMCKCLLFIFRQDINDTART